MREKIKKVIESSFANNLNKKQQQKLSSAVKTPTDNRTGVLTPVQNLRELLLGVLVERPAGLERRFRFARPGHRPARVGQGLLQVF